MKTYIFGILILLGLSSCTQQANWSTVLNDARSIRGNDEALKIDASLAAAKKSKHKHSSCKHYHKKRYE